MSQENVEAVRRAIDAFNRREIPIELFHPEVEWVENPRFPGTKTYRGPEGVKRSIESWWEIWTLVTRLEEIVDAGDRVAFWGATEARGHGSEVTVNGTFGAVWEFRDGLAVRVHVLSDREGALSAAGLSEQASLRLRSGKTGA